MTRLKQNVMATQFCEILLAKLLLVMDALSFLLKISGCSNSSRLAAMLFEWYFRKSCSRIMKINVAEESSVLLFLSAVKVYETFGINL